MDLGEWAGRKVGTAGAPAGYESLTVADLLARDDLPDAVRGWLESIAAGVEVANPPAWVGDEGCWEKAKSAADEAGAADTYAFATWWYLDFQGCPMK